MLIQSKCEMINKSIEYDNKKKKLNHQKCCGIERIFYVEHDACDSSKKNV